MSYNDHLIYLDNLAMAAIDIQLAILDDSTIPAQDKERFSDLLGNIQDDIHKAYTEISNADAQERFTQ